MTTITVHGAVGNVAGQDVYNYASTPAKPATPVLGRVLAFVAASPPSLDSLRLDVELRDVMAALEGSDIVLVPVVAARLEDLHAALVKHAPTYLHFAGHSTEDGIALEGEDGKHFVVGVSFLADLLTYAPSVDVAARSANVASLAGDVATLASDVAIEVAKITEAKE